MEKLSLSIARKIQRIIQGEAIPYGQLKSKVVNQMLEDGVLQIKLQGRSRKYVYSIKPDAASNYLSSQLGINNLDIYISNMEVGTTRAENIIAASDSKLNVKRTFKGFLVNCYYPIEAGIHGQKFIINPIEGTYAYIHDFEKFTLPASTTIVGVENPENFRFIRKQKQLFGTETILFVSRYPQSKDLITWLQNIPNRYLHFGDFDFEGVRIFKDEYFQYLQSKASYYIPSDIEELLNKYGNKKLYDSQYKSSFSTSLSINGDISRLISLFHKYKKCLEQEILIQK